MLYKEICAEYERIETKINYLEDQIKELPSGSFVSTKNGKYYKYYQREENRLTYLGKEKQDIARKLALKKYLTSQLKELRHERLALTMYLNHHKENLRETNQQFANPPYQTLLSSYFISYPQDARQWAHELYERNPKNPEQLIHKSISGNMVRSKSEAMIDMALYQAQIPYRYEAELILSGVTLFPDFTVRHPKTGQLIYWEHFGMMDNPSYSKNVYNKLQLYTANNLIPSIDLITTFETSDHPLSPDLIQKTIEYYFI
ncbi:MAG: ATPase [bacterium]|nr:ATPase [bacterium]